MQGDSHSFDKDAYLRGELSTVFFGSAINNFGVQELLGSGCEECSSGRMTYDLQRLRHHNIIVRESGTQRYNVARKGVRIYLFVSKVYHRVIRLGFSELLGRCLKAPTIPVTSLVKQFEPTVDQLVS